MKSTRDLAALLTELKLQGIDLGIYKESFLEERVKTIDEHNIDDF